MSFHYPLDGGGAGTVDTVTNSDGSLTVSPNTGDVVISLNVGHANTWTDLQTFNAQGIATTITPRINLTNTTAATSGVSNQYPPALQFLGTTYDNTTSQVTGWRFNPSSTRQVSTLRPRMDFDFTTNNGAAWTNVLSLRANAAGGGTNVVIAGNMQISASNASMTGTFSTVGNISATGNFATGSAGTSGSLIMYGSSSGSTTLVVDSTGSTLTIPAATELQGLVHVDDSALHCDREIHSGENGGNLGTLVLFGSTSGNVSLLPATAVTTYQITLPSAQGAGALINDGSGGTTFVIVPQVSGSADLTGQTAAITATTLLTPASTAMYRISVYLQITTAASVSSVLGGATGVVITYNDGDGNVAQTDTMGLFAPNGTVVTTLNSNNTTTNLTGSIEIYAKTGVAIQYAIGYTSVGTAMQYAAHIRCELIK